MGRTKGILLIVAGALVFTPLFFLLGYFCTFWLEGLFIEVAMEPRAYLLLAAELALGSWLMARGYTQYSLPTK